MADIISRKDRSWNMSRIKGKDTKPEVQVRSWLFQHGFRFRKNDPRYPGKPHVIVIWECEIKADFEVAMNRVASILHQRRE